MRAPTALILMGPTASGKSALALALARRFPVEIISVDSAQVFRGMDIGTAKPDSEVRARFPHHLIDLVTPEESYSVARFRDDAIDAMAHIVSSGKTPLLVGGTMLYFKALLEGLSDLPKAVPEIRAEIDAFAAKNGWPAAHAELARADPQTAARLRTTDAQRIQRAIEVYRVSGRPLSALLTEKNRRLPPYAFLSLGILPSDRACLHERISARFDAMLAAGLEDEVIRLQKTWHLSLKLPSMRCVGYRQVWEALEGLYPRAEIRDRGICATRQLAKRQITWMVNTLRPEIFDCLDPGFADKVATRVEKTIRRRSAVPDGAIPFPNHS
ncbi:MAG: tRNA (adenosine(37)-N6)-dimethylallyltransferase MiaA [Candidatus Accumulibacter sp.]|jgi:tRNA dimethylallyltransferase|nr:tRNA (adenosine(37)-N6)-dimethylallyltransferase MiaA [Accumulibacter sp.]